MSTRDEELITLLAQQAVRGDRHMPVPHGYGAAAKRLASTGFVWLHDGVLKLPPGAEHDRVVYRTWRPQIEAQHTVETASAIIAEYAAQGYDLTLRQLYYQFVARDLLPNTQASYNNLGSTVSKARLAGYLPWDAIVDRTRSLHALPHWHSPSDILHSVSKQFRVDLWADQKVRVEVWVEKEALAGVVERTCTDLDVPFFPCRGYVSQSAMYEAGQRLLGYVADDQRVVILHLGDHDPSGIDMTRDICDRLSMFTNSNIEPGDSVEDASSVFDAGYKDPEVVRIALNRCQVDEYQPPPNPAKLTDCRAEKYIREHGPQSWELDALEPRVLDELIRESVGVFVDAEAYQAARERQAEGRERLRALAASI